MIEFDRAIIVAQENVKKLVPGAENIKLEEALISDNEKFFEITYSYEVQYGSSKSAAELKNNHLRTLATILGTRRQYKVFLIDAQTGKFRGFRNKDQ